MFAQGSKARTFSLAVGLLLTGLTVPVDAAPTKPRKSEPQKVSNAQLREGLRVLHATKQTLEAANHDYGGHRVVAVKAIGAAQHQLRLALGMQSKKTGTGKAANPGAVKGKGKGNEPQAVSNMQLAEAIPVLQQTVAVMEKADHDYHGHRVAAVRDLGVAIRHLNKALQYEKKKQ